MSETRDLPSGLRPEQPVDGATAAGEPSSPRRGGRRGLVVVLGVLALLVVAYVIAAVSVGDRLPRSTSVAGVSIGGLAPAEATATLARDLAPRLNEPITVTAGDLSRTLDPADLGLSLDAAATVQEAVGGSAWNPLHLIRYLAGGGEVDPVATVDDSALGAAVAQLATEVDVEPRDAEVRFADGAVSVTDPVPGAAIDQDEAASLVADAFPGGGPVELPVAVADPLVDQADVDRALADFAEPAMSAPITVAVGETNVELTPTDLSPYLSMSPDEAGRLQPALDASALLDAESTRFAEVVRPPVDATFTFTGGVPTVVPAVDGTTIDPSGLAEGMLAALAAAAPDRVTTVTPVPLEAELTTAEAQTLGITEPISEFTTNYPVVEYRLVNIGRAAELIHGSLVLPGETWSLNETVGERTAENGFVKGFIIDGGQFREDYGGGVSQVATTTFNAVFFAGLEDVQHKPHSFYISRYPAGREATVAWPTVDLQFRNDSPTGVLIQTEHSPGSITVRFWGTKAYDEIRSVSSARYNIVAPQTRTETDDRCVDQDPVSGFDITVTREFVQGGEVVRTEDFVTHYNPADRIICN